MSTPQEEYNKVVQENCDENGLIELVIDRHDLLKLALDLIAIAEEMNLPHDACVIHLLTRNPKARSYLNREIRVKRVNSIVHICKISNAKGLSNWELKLMNEQAEQFYKKMMYNHIYR